MSTIVRTTMPPIVIAVDVLVYIRIIEINTLSLSARGAVSGSSFANLELQEFVELLPLDQLICHTPVAIQAWPTATCEEVLAVAHRNLAVARWNVADSTHYLDLHAAHLAACAVPSTTLFR